MGLVHTWNQKVGNAYGWVWKLFCRKRLMLKNMKITIISASPLEGQAPVVDGDLFQSYEVEPALKIRDLIEVITADLGICGFTLSHDRCSLSDLDLTLAEGGVEDGSILCLQKNSLLQKVVQDPRIIKIEECRKSILENPSMLARLKITNTDLADAAVNDPSRFMILMEAQRQKLFGKDNTNVSNFEMDKSMQQQAEEQIRLQNVMANMEAALEHYPESFATVTMLYINCKVNGVEIKAFVDCGAQSTIMTEKCVERCSLSRLIDNRFSGVAHGVGTTKIVGKIHSAQLFLEAKDLQEKLEPIFLPCSITVIEDSDPSRNTPDMLLGLDMLRRHQMRIDLSLNALFIGNKAVTFLPESEIPNMTLD